MAKAGKVWMVKYPASGGREFFRYYYSGNTRTLQHTGAPPGDWRKAPGVIYDGKAVVQRKIRGKWTGKFSKSEKATIRHIRRKHGI